MPPTSRLPSTHINTLSSHTGPINTLAFSNLGGTYILSGSSDRSIHLSRTEPIQSSSQTQSPPQQQPVGAPPTTAPIQKYTSHGYPVLSLSISSQNTHFASSSAGDRSVFYWDIQSPNSTIRRLGSNTSQSHTARITCVSFAGSSGGGGSSSSSGTAPQDSLLISGSDDRSVRLWDLKSRDNRPIQVIEDARDGVSALQVWESEILVGSVDGKIRSYDVRMGRVVVDVQPGAVTSLEVTRDGKCVLVGCLDGKIRLMDRGNGGCLRRFPAEGNNVQGTGSTGTSGYKNESLRLQSAFGANESLVLSGSESDGRVRAWDVVSGKQVDELLVSPSGKVVSVVKWREGSKSQGRNHVWAAGSADGIVRIYGG